MGVANVESKHGARDLQTFQRSAASSPGRIVAVTPPCSGGNGTFQIVFHPCADVGICEQRAVTKAASL